LPLLQPVLQQLHSDEEAAVQATMQKLAEELPAVDVDYEDSIASYIRNLHVIEETLSTLL
jgi:hypothetical protein